jgi:hypothetical protein
VDVAGNLGAAHERLTSLVSEELLDKVTDQVPDLWLEQTPSLGSPTAVRAAYRDHLLARVASTAWVPGGAS